MQQNRTILIITASIFEMKEEYIEQLQRTAPGISITAVPGKQVTSEMIEDAEIIYGWPTMEQLEKARNLKWLHLPSAGADGYTQKDSYCNSDIQVTNSSGVFGIPIAEHVFGMILSFNKNLQEYAYQKEAKQWSRHWETRDFFGSTMAIIGLGDIGTEVAKRGKAWGATILAVKRTMTSAPEYVDRLYPLEQLEEVLQLADYVVLALPSTSKTRGIITKELLRSMKPSAFLVNIGRGALVDQDALIEALKEGQIAGAGLDVTEPEPLPEDNPLWELPNVILTPHTSGGSPSNDQRRNQIFQQNLISYLNGTRLNNLVDFTQEY